MPDIFDQLAAQNTATAPPAATGDIFDQLAAKNKIEGTPGQHGSSYMRSGAFQAGHPPVASPPNWNQLGDTSPEKLAAFTQAHPVAGKLFSTADAFTQPVAGGLAALHGLVNPTAGAAERAGLSQAIPVGQGKLETVAGTAGGLATPVLATLAGGPAAGAAVMAGQGAGDIRSDIAAQRQAGRQISGVHEALAATGGGLLQGAVGLIPGAGGEAGPVLGNMLRSGAENALVGSGAQGYTNLIKQTYNPQQDLTEGLSPNAVVGGTLGVMHAGISGLHGVAPEEAPTKPAWTAPEAAERPAPWQGDVAAEQAKAAAEEAKAAAAHVADLHQRLGQEAVAPRPEHGVGEPPPREKPNEAVEETPGFVKPEDVPQTAEDKEVGNGFFKRLRDLQPENEQRLTENPQPPEGQLERRAFAGATFESPEEAGANKFFAEHQATAEKAAEPTAKPLPGQPSLMNRLMGSESGGTTALHDIVRAVPTAIKNAASGIHDLMASIDKPFGLSDSPQAKQVSGDIRQSLGDAERVSHEVEAKFTPGREAIEKLSPAQKIALHDALEDGRATSHTTPEIAQAAKDLQAWRDSHDERRRALGDTSLDTEGRGASRIWEFPGGGNGKGNSLAGNESFLKKQADLPFSEQLKNVEAMGGKAKYTNPLDDQIHRLYQAEQALEIREGLRAHDKMGAVSWGKPTDNQTERLKDPKIGSETRTLALPKWMVGKIANGPGHFDTEKFLDENESKGTWVRPGENAPDGFAKTARTKKGDFYAAPDVAAKYNNLLKEPKATGIAAIGNKVLSGMVGLRYMLNAGHSFMATHVGAVQQLANAAGRGLHGEGEAALDSLKTMAGLGGNVEGHNFRRSIEAGTAGEAGERVMASGANLHLRSAIKDNTVRKQFADVMNDMESNDPATRVKGLGKGVLTAAKAIHTETFEEVLPNIVAAHLKNVAENQIARGVSAEEGRAEIQSEAKRISRQVGNHFEDPDYRNTTARKIAAALIPAYHFWEGNVINAGKVFTTTEGAAASRAFFATAAGTTGLLNTAIQMALTHHNTGKAVAPWDSDTPVEDLLHPRTGIKDDNGNEGRISYPNPLTRMIDAVRHPLNEAKAIAQPALTGGYETAVNKDWQGNQVRPTDASGTSNFFRGLGHTLKGYTPMGSTDFASSAVNSDEKGMLGAAGGMVGVRVSHPVTSNARQELYDQLSANDIGGRNLEAQQKHDDNKKWADEIAAGNKDQAEQEMKEAGINKHEKTSVLKQARERQEGPWSRVMDSALRADGLIKIWNAATPDEQSQMKGFLQKRIGRDHGSEDANEQAAWKQLKGLVGQ